MIILNNIIKKARLKLPDHSKVNSHEFIAVVWYRFIPYKVRFIKKMVPSGKVIWVYIPPINYF